MAVTNAQRQAARAELARREIERRNTVQEPPPPVEPPPLNLASRGPIAVGETALQLATGVPASIAGGLAGIGAGLIPGGEPAADVVEKVQSALTYQPRTELGQQTSSLAARPFELFEQFADTVGEATGDPEDALGATAVKTAILSAPALLGLKSVKRAPLSNRQQVAKAAQQEGYVVNPSAVTDRFPPTLLEGLGGKLKTAQQASIRNQAVTNRLAARELGLPEGTPIDSAILASIRREAAKAYENIKTSGQVNADITFRRDIANATKEFRQAAQDFPSLAENTLIKAVDDLRNTNSFASGSAIQAIKQLRDKADVSFRAGDKSVGNAYKSAANAFEGVLERNLARTGSQGALEAFKAARQQIAKTYSVEDALVGSDVSAARLAAQLNKKKPLSGDLERIARFAQEFPKVNRTPQQIGGVPAFSPLDLFTGTAGGAAGIATGNPAAALPLLGTLSRPGLRAATLGRLGQRSAVAPIPQIGSPFIPGLIGSGTEAEALRRK